MSPTLRFIDMGCLLLLVAVLAVGGWGIQKNFSTHASWIKNEQEQLINEENRLKLAAAKLEQLGSSFRKKENQIHELNKKIPADAGIGDLLTQVHDRVRKRNITLVDFHHTPGQAFETYRRIPVQLIIDGEFLNIYGLIHDLETLDRIFIFEKIVIRRKKEKNLCQAILMAHVFQQ